MEERKNELHQDDVKEILEMPPHWLVNSGMWIIASFVAFLLIGSYFFQYSDVVKSTVTLSMADQSSSEMYIGRIPLPSSCVGKVHKGQLVIIKLDGYPYTDYGILKSNVFRVVCTRTGNKDWMYEVEIKIDTPMVSSYGNHFFFWQGMSGNVEIITKDVRLSDHLLNPIKSLIK